MKRNKYTDFVLNYFKWTSIFLWDQIYFSRCGEALKEFKKDNNWAKNIDDIIERNNDVLRDYIVGKRVYKVNMKIYE